MKTLRINKKAKVEVRELKTNDNYNISIRILVNGVVMKGYFVKNGTSNEEIKKDAIYYIDNAKVDSLLYTLLN